MRASFILSEVGIGLRRNLTMTVAVVVTVAISLALFGTGLLIRSQVSLMKDVWYDKVEVSVFLCGEDSLNPACAGSGVSNDQRMALQSELESTPLVQEVFYESQDEAFTRFREQFKDSPELLTDVTADQLPESFRVKLSDPTQFDVVASAFQGRPGVEAVQDQKRLLDRFFRVLGGFQTGALVIAAIQLVAAVLLISNTIRVAAFSRRRETGIMRLVGASNLSIQLPFLLEGALAGLLGGLLASGVLVAIKSFFVDGQLRPVFGLTSFVGWSEVLSIVPTLLVAGVLLCGLSSFFTLRRHLRV